MTRRISSLLAVCAALAAPASAQITRVSVSTAGVEANGPSGPPSVSADGRFVVFSSSATNLVAGDSNGVEDIFLRDRDTDADGVFDEGGAVATTRLSVAAPAVEADGPSTAPAITPDGRYVAFVSTAANLVAGATGVTQVYRLDRTTNAIVRVSRSDAGAAGDRASDQPVISADGSVVAFRSTARNLVADPGSPLPHIFVREIAADRTLRLTPLETAAAFSAHSYFQPTISDDGLRVSYVGTRQMTPTVVAWVHDRATGWRQVFDDLINYIALDRTGRLAVLFRFGFLMRAVVDTRARTPFLTAAEGLTVPPVSPNGRYAFSGGAVLADFDLGVSTPLGIQSGGGDFSADDRWLVVSSVTSTLLPGNTDANGAADVFAIDLPARLDLDADTMDDRWESLFAVTDPNADPDGDGATNAAEENAGTHPNGVLKRYLAEGATGSFYSTRIGLANPDLDNPAIAVVTFDSGDGVRASRAVPIRAGSSAFVDVGATRGFESADVSTTIESDRLLVAERVMEWGFRPGFSTGYGSHSETATAAPSATWFLAEGSTVLDFDLFYLLQNPQAVASHATVRYLLPSGAVVTRSYDLPPGSRTTIYVNQVPGLDETDVSGDISADVPIIVERAMYRSVPGQPFTLGTGAMGVTAPAARWFLAEGATGSFFDLYVLIANPGDIDAQVTADYARTDGSVVTQAYVVRAHSRFSVFVDVIPGLASDSVATTVTSTNAVPIVVERAMYWPTGFFQYHEGHASAGATVTAHRWACAGLGGSGQAYLLIANTENRPGQAEIRILPATGITVPSTVNLPPNSRTTLFLGVDGDLSGALVTSTGPSPVAIVVESASYDSQDSQWTAGRNALATPLP